jgi:hypothetical protein
LPALELESHRIRRRGGDDEQRETYRHPVRRGGCAAPVARSTTGSRRVSRRMFQPCWARKHARIMASAARRLPESAAD